MKKKTLFNRLLSGSLGPSVQEREMVWQKILAQTQSSRRAQAHPWRVLVMPGLAAATVGCLAVVVMLASAPLLSPPSGFTPRGQLAAVGDLKIRCSDMEASVAAERITCKLGATLVVAVQPAVDARFLSLAALGPGGLLVHYFPADGIPSASIPQDQVLNRGVVVGPEHTPGLYKIYGIFSRDALSPAEVVRVVEVLAEGKRTPYKVVTLVMETLGV